MKITFSLSELYILFSVGFEVKYDLDISFFEFHPILL